MKFMILVAFLKRFGTHKTSHCSWKPAFLSYGSNTATTAVVEEAALVPWDAIKIPAFDFFAYRFGLNYSKFYFICTTSNYAFHRSLH